MRRLTYKGQEAYSDPDLHVLLLMLDPSEGSAQLLDHVLQLVMAWLLLSIIGGITGSISNVHTEHDNLGCHGGHLVRETVLVHTVHVGCKGVLAIRLSLTLYREFEILNSSMKTWRLT